MIAAATPKRREARTKEPQKPPSSLSPRMLEGLAVLLFGLAVFCFVAIVTYHPLDPSLNRIPPKTWQVRNSAGLAGAYVADAAGQLLGSAALFLPLAALLIGIRWIRGRRVETPWALSGGLVLGTLVAVVSLHGLAGGPDPLFGPRVPAGGLLGGILTPLLFRVFGGVGGTLLLVATGIFAVLQIASLGLSDFLRGLSWVFRGIVRMVSAGLRVTVGTLLKSAGRLLAGLWRGLARAAAGLRPERIEWAAFFERMGITKITLPEPEASPDEDGDDPEVPLRLDPMPIGALVPGHGGEEGDAGKAGVEEAELEEVSADSAPASPSSASAPVIEIASPIERVRRKKWRAHSLPPLTMLDDPPPPVVEADREALTERSAVLEEKLRDYGVEGRVVQVLHGPVVTMFEYAPASGVKVSKIVNLSDDLALAMRALSVRIVAPIPGKGAVGIEIPNRIRQPVALKDILTSRDFQEHGGRLPMALGKDILGRPAVTDLAQIPHLLIAGATGSGKSVGLNSMICSLLFRRTPREVRFVMVDPKMLELSVYDGIPHLLTPVVTYPRRAAAVLKGLVEEMEKRYQLLSEAGVRNVEGYNTKVASGENGAANGAGREEDGAREALPYIVVVIDELADLMMVTSKDVEDAIIRLAQMARAAGIHLLVATQRPSVDVLTGLIKANFPARLSFQVSSRTDSRTILDANGAERLLGRGDMLFLPPGTSNLIRIHGAYVSEKEISRVVEFLKRQGEPEYDETLLSSAGESAAGEGLDEEGYDEKYDEAVELVARTRQASISMVQRRLRVGYNRAARMIERMEREGVVGPSDGVKPREVYVREIPQDE
ncbi:MAG: DNA translocase FtsK [Nitrospinota bacterium]